MTDGDGILGAKKQLRQRQFRRSPIDWIFLGRAKLISWLPNTISSYDPQTTRYGIPSTIESPPNGHLL